MNLLDIIEKLERKGIANACVAHKFLQSALTFWGPKMRAEVKDHDPLDLSQYLSDGNRPIRSPLGYEDQPFAAQRFMQCVEAYEAFAIEAQHHALDPKWDNVMHPYQYAMFISKGVQSSQGKERVDRAKRRLEQINKNPALKALFDAQAAQRSKRDQVDNERLKEDLPWALSEFMAKMSLAPEQFDLDRGFLEDGSAEFKYDPASNTYKSLGLTVQQAYEQLIEPKPEFEDGILSKILDRLMTDHAWMDESSDFEALAFLSLQDILFLAIDMRVDPLKQEHVRTVGALRKAAIEAAKADEAAEPESSEVVEEGAPLDDDFEDEIPF